MSDKTEAPSTLDSKRAQFTGTDPKKRPTMKVVIVLTVFALGALGVAGYFLVSSFRGEATGDLVKSDTVVKVALASLDDGQARFFDHKVSDNTSVRFFALKSADGKYRAAMDACDTCFHAKRGYKQVGDAMICNNCGMRFQSNLINEVKGGCNPVGLACTIEGNQLVIQKSDLDSRSHYFQ